MHLRRNRLRLAPRALTLTLFLRLFVADVFVHGIGGGHYDRVLDRLLVRRWGVEPPAFCVATATLFHPDALGVERVCPECLKHEGHRLRHAVLADEKADWLRRIEAGPTFRASRDAFDAMHARRRELLRTDAAYAGWRRRWGRGTASLPGGGDAVRPRVVLRRPARRPGWAGADRPGHGVCRPGGNRPYGLT